MNSTTYSPKHIEKVSSDNLVVGFDLLSNLTYMQVVGMGGLPRHQVLHNCGKQKLTTAVFFEYINVLSLRLGMASSDAFRLVAERAKASSVKSLLLRFAAALGSGESESDFIDQETRLESQKYGNQYERTVENLRKWTDAYAAILVSVSLIMVVSLVSTMLGSLDETFVVMMAFTVFCVTSIGVFVIYRVSPYEQMTYDSPEGIPPSRRKSRLLLLIGVPTGLVLALLVGPQFGLITGAALGFLLVGFSILPGGWYAWKDDMEVARLDHEIPTFVRSVGEIAGSAGVTLTEAISRIDTRALQSLGRYIDRLYIRLSASLPTPDCWERFRAETGSELVNRSTHMLVDGTDLGGRPDQVGHIVSDYAEHISQLRATRSLTSSTFSYLSVPMHGTVVFILVFVYQIVSVFSAKMAEVSSDVLKEAINDSLTISPNIAVPPGLNLPAPGDLTAGLSIFGSQDMGIMGAVIVAVIAIMTIANTMAPKFAAGGSNLKIASYFSITCIVTGALMGIVPLFTKALFSIS